jgi:hypothetical protein
MIWFLGKPNPIAFHELLIFKNSFSLSFSNKISSLHELVMKQKPLINDFLKLSNWLRLVIYVNKKKQETSIWSFLQWTQYETIWKKTMFQVSMK